MHGNWDIHDHFGGVARGRSPKIPTTDLIVCTTTGLPAPPLSATSFPVVGTGIATLHHHRHTGLSRWRLPPEGTWRVSQCRCPMLSQTLGKDENVHTIQSEPLMRYDAQPGQRPLILYRGLCGQMYVDARQHWHLTEDSQGATPHRTPAPRRSACLRRSSR